MKDLSFPWEPSRRLEEGGLGKYREHFGLCQKCRSRLFAERLVGNRLEMVGKVKHVAKRRQEKLVMVRTDKRLGTTVHKSECFICNQGCDALVHVKDRKVIRGEGDPSSVVTKGTLCCKGLALKELLYPPDRLLYPLKRSGKRGEEKWEQISWDEALNTITKRFNEIEEEFGENSIVLARVQIWGGFAILQDSQMPMANSGWALELRSASIQE